MTLQIISYTKAGGAQVVMKDAGKSTTLHLDENWRDRWGQSYAVEFAGGGKAALTPPFLAQWYGNRAVTAIKGARRNADALVRTAIRYAFLALPEAAPVTEAA